MALSVKINDKTPRPLRGYELPERHGIVFRGPVLKLPDEGLERMYVSVTNYDDSTFLMKFETGPYWATTREAVCSTGSS